jgi:hypothetical protein
MDFFDSRMWPFMVPIVAIIGGIMVAIVSTIAKGRIRELEIRERIAMIERGMVPPPETDPVGFERSLRSVEDLQYRHSGPRLRTGGTVVMSIGFGLMLLISMTSGSADIGVGVGGFLVILGFGIFISSLWSGSRLPPMPLEVNRRPPAPSGGATPPSGPVDPR